MLSRQEDTAGGCTKLSSGIMIGETHTGYSQCVQVWDLNCLLAVGAELSVTEVVG
jgi:hypothetical protein